MDIEAQWECLTEIRDDLVRNFEAKALVKDLSHFKLKYWEQYHHHLIHDNVNIGTQNGC